MAYEVHIEKTNNSFLTVYSDEPCVHQELYDLFKVKDPSHKPSKYSKYDGTVRLYDKNTGRLPAGLLRRLLQHVKTYKVTIDPRFKNIRELTRDELSEWVYTLGLPFELHEYQFEAIYQSIKSRRLVALADTGAGKSAIIYCVIRFLLESGSERALILVPSILLVEQMLADFVSYGWKEAPTMCQQILSGRSKRLTKPVVISTWQSLQDEDIEYFETVDAVISDEVHSASAKKQSKIIERCRNAVDRLGVTGTLSGQELHQFQVEGLFGPCVRFADTQMLKDLGQAAQTQVTFVHNKYTELDKVRLSKLDFIGQVEYIMKHETRQLKVAKLVKMLSEKKENTLIVFDRVEKGLEPFLELLVGLGLGDKVRVINGGVKLAERFGIKNEMEDGEGLILLATWGTMSTGVSIKKLHNLVLNSSTKKLIRVLQTLGRVLRIHDTKTVAKIFDMVDDTRRGSSSHSAFIEHAKDRHSHYTLKKHPVRNISVNLDGPGVSKEDFEIILKESTKRVERRVEA